MRTIDEQVRAAETYIDDYHKRSPLMQVGCGDALLHTLYAYDLRYLVEHETRRRSNDDLKPGQLQNLRLIREGYIQACRWIAKDPDPRLSTLREDLSTTDDAWKLCDVGTMYSLISDFYRLYSRGIVFAETVDETVIRFEYKEGRSGHPFGFLEVANEERLVQKKVEDRSDALKAAVSEVFTGADHLLQHGRVVLPRPETLSIPAITEFYSSLYDYDAYFNGSDTLGPCTLSEFVRFWIALRSWSECCLTKYMLLISSGRSQEECMPTQIEVRERLAKKLAKMAGLGRDVTEELIGILSFGHANPRSDAIVTPLFQMGQYCCWSAYAVITSRQPRNYLKALARNVTYKAEADNAIGERERRFVKDQAQRLEQQLPWKTEAFIDLGPAGDIDFCAWSSHCPTELLLVEVKMVLHADDLNEVFAASKYFEKGQRQIRTAIAFLEKANQSELRQRFGSIPIDKIDRIFGIVVSPETEPESGHMHADIPVVSWVTLLRNLPIDKMESPRDIYEAAIERKWEANAREGMRFFERYQIGEVAFDTPATLPVSDLEEIKTLGLDLDDITKRKRSIEL